MKFAFNRYKAEVGTIQEMILTNAEASWPHPIHMHVNHMQVGVFRRIEMDLLLHYNMIETRYIYTQTYSGVSNQ